MARKHKRGGSASPSRQPLIPHSIATSSPSTPSAGGVVTIAIDIASDEMSDSFSSSSLSYGTITQTDSSATLLGVSSNRASSSTPIPSPTTAVDEVFAFGTPLAKPASNSSLKKKKRADDSASISSCDSHKEPHFAGAEIVRDVVVGLSDGLTVPFALAAGLSSLGSSKIVVVAGMAEIVAGAISMGLGGYLAGRSEIEHYDAERKREFFEIETVPDKEEDEIVEIFEPYGLDRPSLEPLISLLKACPEKWVDFMMKFELALEKPDVSRSWVSALTIGGSYFMGGLVPLLPYMLEDDARLAFYFSIATTLLVLFIFGYAKALFVGINRPLSSAVQMTFIGAVAAGVAYGVASLFPVEIVLNTLRTL